MPAGVASVLPGDAAVRLAESAGLHLDEWQQFVLRESLGVRADGKWAAFSSCVIVPRQNGKGAVLEAVALAGLFLFKCELIVWTAHEMKTAKEGFRRLVSLIVQTPDLNRQVAKIKHGNDDRGVELHDGRRIQFLARSSGSGRGFTGDLIILDEAYELDGDVMAALLPTLSAVPNPQIWYTSSAPMEKSEQLHSVRKRGVAGSDSRLAFFEWSVDPSGFDSLSEESWALANPGFGLRIDRDAIEAEWAEFHGADDPSKFNRERLGVPDELLADQSVIDPAVWAGLVEAGSRIETHRRWSVAVSPDRRWSTIGVAGRRADGCVHVEWMDRRPGTSWVVDAVAASWASVRVPIRIHKKGPESFLIAQLRERGVEVVEVSSDEVAQATGQLIDAVAAGTLRHLGQGSLDVAVRGAVLRMSSDGAALWSQRHSSVEITPLMAVTVALGGVPVGTADLAANIW